MKPKKIGIIGAGPAGGLLALRLAKAGLQVLLFDHRAPWEKPCAGGIAPYLWDEFPELEPLKQKSRPNHRAAIVSVSGQRLEVELRKPLYVLSRKTFGAFLIENAVAAGVKFIPAKVISLEKKATGFELEDSRSDKHPVDFLVGADGVGSLTRRKLAGNWQRPDYFFTRSLWLRGTVDMPITFQFFPGLFGYSWIFPGQGEISLGIGSRGLRLKSEPMFECWQKTLRFLPESAQTGIDLQEQSVSYLIPALRFSKLRGQRVAGEDWALLGDACGSAQSVSGGGIYYALKNATQLEDAILRGRLEDYPLKWWELARQELAGPALWGPIFYASRTQDLLAYFLGRSASAKKLVGALLSGDKPPRRQILSDLLKMVAGF
jgi:menaquinone-9 beta-reductase